MRGRRGDGRPHAVEPPLGAIPDAARELSARGVDFEGGWLRGDAPLCDAWPKRVARAGQRPARPRALHLWAGYATALVLAFHQFKIGQLVS